MVKEILNKIFGSKNEDYTDLDHEREIMETHISSLKIYQKNCENLSRADRFSFIDKLREFSRAIAMHIESEENKETCKSFETKCDIKINNTLNKMPTLIANIFIVRDLDVANYVKIHVANSIAKDGYLLDYELNYIKDEIARVEESLSAISLQNENNAIKRRYINDLRQIRVYIHRALEKN